LHVAAAQDLGCALEIVPENEPDPRAREDLVARKVRMQ